MKFEWDNNKRQTNLDKHGVDFAGIIPLFFRQEALMLQDKRYSGNEQRYRLFCPDQGVVFQVAYTVRDNEVIRIISARRANKRERRYYEQRKNN
mgnify:CR=1 FL=1